MKIDWKRKLTSRKFWMAIASFVSMLIIALGVNQDIATQIVAIIMAAGTVIAYIFGEGLADQAGAISYSEDQKDTIKEEEKE